MDDQQTEIRMMYKNLTTDLRNKYSPHYNLYQKQTLDEKINCFKQNSQQPELYYKCFTTIDERMQSNSVQLQQSFNKIEIEDSGCQQKCKDSYQQDNIKQNMCLKKCMEDLRDKAFKLQDTFYQAILKSNPEFKKIK
ncbi:unnamed protein product [Paramecium primaurelia]|uniref:Uncharacterized protein n=1 Tax=Paramecium primaurelia TaxID=5886 RepID=A0A8S1K2Z8_PARPR|nr:unnamed protein product [Paramecium primaurelia]